MSTAPRIIDDFSSIDARDWERMERAGNPFLNHAFLCGLESSGSVSAESGWQPNHLGLFEDGRLVAFCPSYLKSHSHGEFVFDWSWADAYHRNRLEYYPKLLTAIPYTPVTGPRLLVRRDHPEKDRLRRQLVELALQFCEENDLSTWHCNFTHESDLAAFEGSGLLARSDWQFHWSNPGYGSFEDFLARLRSRKRKNIRRERRQVSEAGIRYSRRSGGDLSTEELDFVYHCYRRTFLLHGNHAALNRQFFSDLVTGCADQLVVIIGARDDEPIAMSLYLTGGGRLYGRYWGTMEDLPGLHFETAYYQGMDYCIEHGIGVFESGAQGEHKIARGFTPVRTRSFHLVRHRIFRAAIADALERESEWLDDYRRELARHEPYRRETAP